MKPMFALILVALHALGCAPKTNSPTKTPDTSPTPGSTTALGEKQPATTGASDTITPIGPNVGAMTPVAGGENLGSGTGGGVGQMAKQQAKNAAAQSSSTGTASDSSE